MKDLDVMKFIGAVNSAIFDKDANITEGKRGVAPNVSSKAWGNRGIGFSTGSQSGKIINGLMAQNRFTDYGKELDENDFTVNTTSFTNLIMKLFDIDVGQVENVRSANFDKMKIRNGVEVTEEDMKNIDKLNHGGDIVYFRCLSDTMTQKDIQDFWNKIVKDSVGRELQNDEPYHVARMMYGGGKDGGREVDLYVMNDEGIHANKSATGDKKQTQGSVQQFDQIKAEYPNAQLMLKTGKKDVIQKYVNAVAPNSTDILDDGTDYVYVIAISGSITEEQALHIANKVNPGAQYDEGNVELLTNKLQMLNKKEKKVGDFDVYSIG